MAKTRVAGAPSAFSTAKAARLRSISPRTALATPAPPATRAVSATSVSNCEKRSRLRENCGDAASRLRMSQPASGKAAPDGVGDGRDLLVARIARQREAGDVAHDGSGPHQAGGPERVEGNQHARAKADAPGELVRLAAKDRADFESRGADGQEIADFRVEPRDQQRIGDKAEDVASQSQHSRDGFPRLRLQRAEDGVDAWIDGLQLHQRGIGAVRRRRGFAFRHRAHQRDFVDAAVLFEPGAFVGLNFAMGEVEGDVAAENRAPLFREPLRERAREAVDAGNRGDADHDAGDEDAKAPGVAEQIAQSEAQSQRKPVQSITTFRRNIVMLWISF